MATVKCDLCGKEFKSGLSLKIHKGMSHGGKAKKGKGRKAGAAVAAAPAAKGKFVCSLCGRSFKMPAHLARHTTASHKTVAKPKAARVAPPVGRPKTVAVTVGAAVANLSVDKLLALKGQVDARLAAIVALMRKAKVGL